MNVSVWIREQLGCRDEYFLQYVVVLHILLETPFLVHCLHFLTTVGCTACSLFFQASTFHVSPVNIVQENS